MSSDNHHVAWADRIGLNKQWARDIEACSDSYGSNTYHHMVRRFKNNIPNIKNGPQLQNMIIEYENHLFKNEYHKILKEWMQTNPEDAQSDSYVLQKEDEIRMYLDEELYKFIIQTLEDHGFGFYRSKMDEVTEKMI